MDGFFFTEQDTAVNYQEDKPFFAKFNPEGDLIWRILRTNQHGELFHTIKLDNEDNLYVLGDYVWDDYKIADTILYNPWYMGVQRTNRALVIKYNSDGVYDWIAQLEGDYESSSQFDLAISEEKNDVVISGLTGWGEIKFGNVEYTLLPGYRNEFLWNLDRISGRYRSHGYDSGEKGGRFANIYFDTYNILNMYFTFGGNEEIFGTFFPGDPGGGYLVKCTADLISSISTDTPPDNDYLIYPNPILSGNNLQIIYNESMTDQNVFYTIYNIMGAIILSGPGHTSPCIQEVNTSGLSFGVYVLSLQIGNKSINQRFIVQ